MKSYAEFLASKRHLQGDFGFDANRIPGMAKPFQRHLIEWACRKGRSAIFADCGLGKSLMQLAWADNVLRHTGKSVLILTPLAVAGQTVKEGEKFGIECVKTAGGDCSKPGIYVANYEKLHHFRPEDFDGLVCDESSILKDYDGKTTQAITQFFRNLKYRLLCTATASPNDYHELGTSSEALGCLGYQDMLSMYFVKETAKDYLGWGRTKPRLRTHAFKDFWRWVCSWSRAVRRPSDLGYSDDGYILPPLLTTEHVVKARKSQPGRLFDVPVQTVQEQAEERRRTINERCEMVADLFKHNKPAIAWCHLNPEGDLLAKIIPGAVQVAGKDSDAKKEEAFDAFAKGQIRVLVTKPSIAGYGLNWQHCAHQSFFPSHSFEQYYQAVRRSWRFGQTNSVKVDLITTEGEMGVLENLKRKSNQADVLFEQMVSLINEAYSVVKPDHHVQPNNLPGWLAPRKRIAV